MTLARPGPVDIAAGLDAATVGWGTDGLVAGVVQDVADGRVLMVGWLDAEALTATLASGEVHFHSRSRGRLWRKGEESGNTMRVVELRTDCDQDALWLKVELGGAEACCHTGRRSCFYRALPIGKGAAAGVASLRQAWDAVQHGETLADRARRVPELARAIEFFGKKAA